MINRLFKPKSHLPLPPLSKYSYRNFFTEVTTFGKGCIIRIRDNDKNPEENESDLIKAIPLEIRAQDNLAIIVSPIAISSKDKEGKRHVLTKDTHIATCVSPQLWKRKLVFMTKQL